METSLEMEEYRERAYALFDEVLAACEKHSFSLNRRDAFLVQVAALLPLLAGGLVDAMQEDKGRWPTVDEVVLKLADKPDRVCIERELRKRGAPVE